RPQFPVVTVDLQPRRAAAHGAEIADDIAVDSIEHKGRPRVAAARLPPVTSGDIEALPGHANTGQCMDGPAHSRPHAPVLAGKAHVILATFGLPVADPILG